MSKRVVTLSLEAFNELIKKLEEYKVIIEKLNAQIDEYNKKFSSQRDNDVS